MSDYCLVENGVIIDGPRPAPRSWLTFSGFDLLPDERLREYGWLPEEIVGFEPFDDATQIRTGPVRSIEADKVVSTYTVRDKTAEELAADLAALKQAAGREIDSAAEAARLAFITDGAGQALVYEAKRSEAVKRQAIVDGGGTPVDAEYPLMQARATRRKSAMQAVADEWNAKAAAWTTAAAAIEDVREGAKEAVAVAASESEIETILAGLVWPTPG